MKWRQFKTLVIKMLNEVRKKRDELSENFGKEKEALKRTQEP